MKLIFWYFEKTFFFNDFYRNSAVNSDFKKVISVWSAQYEWLCRLSLFVHPQTSSGFVRDSICIRCLFSSSLIILVCNSIFNTFTQLTTVRFLSFGSSLRPLQCIELRWRNVWIISVAKWNCLYCLRHLSHYIHCFREKYQSHNIFYQRMFLNESFWSRHYRRTQIRSDVQGNFCSRE